MVSEELKSAASVSTWHLSAEMYSSQIPDLLAPKQLGHLLLISLGFFDVRVE
jgi:hypothetical protein